MEKDGTIVLMLRAEGPGGIRGDGLVRYAPTDPKYQEVLKHLGGLKPGEEKPVPPWPDTGAPSRGASKPEALQMSRKCDDEELAVVVLLAEKTDPAARQSLEHFAGTLSWLGHARERASRKTLDAAWRCLEKGIAELGKAHYKKPEVDDTGTKLGLAETHAGKKEWSKAYSVGMGVLLSRLTTASRELRHYFADFRVDQYEPGTTTLDEAKARQRATLLAERAATGVELAKKAGTAGGAPVRFPHAEWKVFRIGDEWLLTKEPPAGSFALVGFDRFGAVPTVRVGFATR